MAVELAASGEEGIAALGRAEESGSPFPLIFIDAEMPNMDGFELVQRNPPKSPSGRCHTHHDADTLRADR